MEKARQLFRSSWITTERFIRLAPIDVFHKELTDNQVAKSAVTNYHAKFRKKLWLGKCENVKIKISADDYYKLYINGSFVCQGPAPAYAEYYNFNEADISRYVKNGENVIAVHVYYQGLINRVWNSGDNRQGMIADIYADGKYIGGTDNTWKYCEAKEFSGKAIGYDTAFAENINFNLKEAEWILPDFDDSHFISAIEAAEDDHRFVEQATECIDVYKVMPQSVVKINDTDFFVDFGKEIVGQFFMTCKGEKNQKVSVMYAEEKEDGEPYEIKYNTRCNCEYIDTCTLSGRADEFEFYDYKAFRYVKVVTDRDNLNADSFCAIVRNHKFQEKVFLNTNVPHLQEIWDLCAHTLKIGVQEGFLDCPTREKGQYLGDFTVSGLAYMYLTGDSEIYKKTLFDFARTAKVCKGLLGVAPGSFMQEIADFSLQYPLQVLNYYHYTNDTDTLRELYPAVYGVLQYFETYKRADGLLEGVNDKWNLIDWPQNLRDGYEIGGEDKTKPNPCHNVLNAFYIAALKTLEEIQTILGIPAENVSREVSEAYLKTFYDKDKRLFADTEDRSHYALHSNVLPAAFGIAPMESRENIKNMIVSKGLCCGTQFSYFVLKALSALEAREEELNLIVNESEHSWVNMLREDATTCFEAWGKEQKWNTSLCHPWSCAPVIAIIEDIAGVTPRKTDGDIYLEINQ